MKKMLLLGILTTGCLYNGYAQTEITLEQPKVKKLDHYVGVQVNSLIRQVFNFNNSTSAATVNPYQLIYHVNMHRSGWGLRVGAGYNFSSTAQDDGAVKSESKMNSVQVRLGIEKRFQLSRKWSAGVGLDGLYNSSDNYTKSVVHAFDTTTTVNKTLLPSYGGGGMAWLRYNITDRVQIGTEASFYYTTGKERRTVEVTRKRPSNIPPFTPIETMTVSESKPTISEGTFRSPVVFFLLVNF